MAIPAVPLALTALGGVGIVAVAVKAKSAADKRGVAAECEAIRVQIEHLAATGGDPHLLETLRVDLAACARKAANQGVMIDVETVTLLPCRATRAYMDAQWQDYKRTSYTDSVARDNKRNALLAQGNALVQCLSAALASAATPAQIDAVMADIDGARRDSMDRALCLITGGPGCGRFAENEESGVVRARKELETIGIPLGVEWRDGFGSGGWGFEAIDVDHWPAFPIFFRAASGATPFNGTWGRRRLAGFPDGWTHGGLYAAAEARRAAISPTINVTPGQLAAFNRSGGGAALRRTLRFT